VKMMCRNIIMMRMACIIPCDSGQAYRLWTHTLAQCCKETRWERQELYWKIKLPSTIF
jgi:hypothetical protein